MKPDFGLDFRGNEITLLHRQEGGWAVIGRVAMDDPDLDAAMGYLRATALGLSPRGVAAKLILPNEAVLYTSVAGLPYDSVQRAGQIATALVGRTPYDVDDLVYDWTDSGDTAHVAVIARETLAEAEAFANQHRFNPVSFAALPDQGDYDGEVWFGPTQLSQTLLAQGEVVERDDVAVYTPHSDAPPQTALQASDFEMGAETAVEDESPLAAELAAETAAEPAIESATEVLGDGPDNEAISETEAPPEQEKIEAPAEKRPEVWKDFIAADVDQPSPALDAEVDLGLQTSAQSAEPPFDPFPEPAALTPIEPAPAPAPIVQPEPLPDLQAAFELGEERARIQPSVEPETDFEATSFDKIMDETPEPKGDEEAPMAVDVPLIDEDFAPATGQDPKPQSKAEQMLAAFTARRNNALAKAEAATNAARREPALTMATQNGADSVAVAADVSDTPLIGAPKIDGAHENQSADHASAPKLGAAQRLNGQDPAANAAPDIPNLAAQRQPAVKHVPAKNLPKKPQNLAAMPSAKRTGGGSKLGWLLTAVLLISLAAAAAMSTYFLETVNSFFQSEPTSEMAQSDAPAVELKQLPPPNFDSVAQTAAPDLGPDLGPVVDANLADTLTLASRTEVAPSAPTLPANAQTGNADAGLENALAALPLVPNPQPTDPLGDQTARGATIVASLPPIAPIPRPESLAVAAPADIALASARPQARPAPIEAAAVTAQNLVQPAAPPFADPALASARPNARPAGILAAGREARLSSAPASLVASAESAAIESALTALEPEAVPDPNRSALALSVSRIPAQRPRGLKAAFEASLIAAAAPSPPPQPEPPAEEVVARAPTAAETEDDITLDGRAGSRSIVDRQATVRNGINLRSTNLVGIFGSNANRYALIRQPNGTFKKLKVGDRFDGGRIAAITESEVRYDKGGNLLALRMPNG